MTVTVEIPIPPADVRYLVRLLHADRRRARREYERSDFVPEPGHRDAKLHKIERITDLLDLLEEYV